MSRRPGDSRIIQAAVAFWHNASDDDAGTMPEEWTIVDGWDPAPGYYTTIVRRVCALGWRFHDDITRHFPEYWGGEVAVETKGNRICEVCFFNGRVPHNNGRAEGCTYDHQGTMIWHYKSDDREDYEVTYGANFGSGKGSDSEAKFQPAREKKERPQKPENYGSWS